MKIIKYKKLSNNRYKIYIENNEEYIFFEDVILKYNLLITKEFNDQLKKSMDYDNSLWEIYYYSIKSLKSRFKSRTELYSLLLHKEYSSDQINIILDKLTMQGYLNDDLFCKQYINNQLITTNCGPGKIKINLEKKGVSDQIIYSNLEDIYTDDIQCEKIDKLINKFIKSNRNKGGSFLRKKIFNYLVQLGFFSNLINQEFSKFDFNLNDNKIYDNEYNKLFKKYSKKYNKEELEFIIKQKLYLKGLKKSNWFIQLLFYFNDVVDVLDSVASFVDSAESVLLVSAGVVNFFIASSYAFLSFESLNFNPFFSLIFTNAL